MFACWPPSLLLLCKPNVQYLWCSSLQHMRCLLHRHRAAGKNSSAEPLISSHHLCQHRIDFKLFIEQRQKCCYSILLYVAASMQGHATRGQFAAAKSINPEFLASKQTSLMSQTVSTYALVQNGFLWDRGGKNHQRVVTFCVSCMLIR
jgi:hypothetical protein